MIIGSFCSTDGISNTSKNFLPHDFLIFLVGFSSQYLLGRLLPAWYVVVEDGSEYSCSMTCVGGMAKISTASAELVANNSSPVASEEKRNTLFL